MITYLGRKHMYYDSQGRDVLRVFIAVSNTSELPTKYSIPDVAIHEASRAWDVSTGKRYGFTDANGWVEQATVINPMTLKGTVSSVSELPQNAEIGWVYLVGTSSDTDFKEYLYTENGWEFIGYNNIIVDSVIDPTSENPVQNKVIASALNGKVNTEAGKGLSSNDYTSEEKTKLAGLSALTPATASTLGGVKIGSGLDVTNDGTLSTTIVGEILSETAYAQLVTKDKDIYFTYD